MDGDLRVPGGLRAGPGAHRLPCLVTGWRSWACTPPTARCTLDSCWACATRSASRWVSWASLGGGVGASGPGLTASACACRPGGLRCVQVRALRSCDGGAALPVPPRPGEQQCHEGRPTGAAAALARAQAEALHRQPFLPPSLAPGPPAPRRGFPGPQAGVWLAPRPMLLQPSRTRTHLSTPKTVRAASHPGCGHPGTGCLIPARATEVRNCPLSGLRPISAHRPPDLRPEGPLPTRVSPTHLEPHRGASQAEEGGLVNKPLLLPPGALHAPSCGALRGGSAEGA